jgi:hypothetical protein
VRFDLESLPRATWGRPSKNRGFSMKGDGRHYRAWVRGPLFAEIVLPRRWPAASFEMFTGGTFGDGDPPGCGGKHHGSVPAYWTGLSWIGWTDSGVNVEMERGELDTSSCVGSPAASVAARAAAIVPGWVYGLRVAYATGPLDTPSEQLLVFLPRGAFVSSGGDPADPLRAVNTGAFTRLSFPVDESSGAVTVRLSPASLQLWTDLRKTKRPVWGFKDEFRPDNDLMVGVDVVAQGERRTGSIVVSMPSRAPALGYGGLLEAVSRAAAVD